MIAADVFKGRDFLTIADFTPTEIDHVLEVASAQKRAWAVGNHSAPLAGQAIAVVLQKPSMRTRISFEIACFRLGAHPVIMSGPDGAFSRGETVHDTARVMERYVDAIVIRTFEQRVVEELAEAASVPVINALTDDHHPCQGLADLLTIKERFGEFAGRRFVYVGDGSNNMAHTYLLGCASVGMDVTIATPDEYPPATSVLADAEKIASQTGARVSVTSDPQAAVDGADVIATDTWASMGQEDEHAERVALFLPYRVDRELMKRTAETAIFLHCLPAHRGEEVTDDVMDGPQSAIYDEAENRLHAQKALLSLVLG